MQVLAVLLDGQGSLVDRDTLLNLVWGRVIVTPGTLTRLIAELRRVLGDDPLKPRFIETIHTKGYRWIAAVASAKRIVRRSGPPERSIELIGRDEDLTQLQVIAATSLLLTLAGLSGTGKTQLALNAGPSSRKPAAELGGVDRPYRGGAMIALSRSDHDRADGSCRTAPILPRVSRERS